MKKTHLIILSIICSLSLTKPVLAANTKKLSVPFTSQAPFFNWAQPWQDACEEAAITIVDYFYANKKFTPDIAKAAILEKIKIKEKFIGKSLDEDAKIIVYLINNFLPWEAYIITNPTIDQIKAELENNRPVIIPAYGKALYNKYFKNGGPEYHSLVISGYDDEKQEFITQEPGTRYGLDFRYSYDIIMNAIHDYLPNKQTKNGQKKAIFTKPNIEETISVDADNDGLGKADEIELKTLLWMADSDEDGYNDGTELQYGYSPLSNSKKQLLGTLIKAVNDTRVYLLQNGFKRHIVNEQVFLNYGFIWAQIIPVTAELLDRIQTGKEINN